jgi:hypothetical protein
VRLHRWSEFSRSLRAHLTQRLKDRRITLNDLDKLRVWVESQPDVPEGDWYKDFGAFKICGKGPAPVTFLDDTQIPWGKNMDESDKSEQ